MGEKKLSNSDYYSRHYYILIFPWAPLIYIALKWKAVGRYRGVTRGGAGSGGRKKNGGKGKEIGEKEKKVSEEEWKIGREREKIMCGGRHEVIPLPGRHAAPLVTQPSDVIVGTCNWNFPQ